VSYLTTPEVADLLHVSERTVAERTRLRTIPHRVAPGGRRCLFDPEEIRQWLDGSPLEVVELDEGGRVVRPATMAVR
jgi:excisionase family DNA binding protein